MPEVRIDCPYCDFKPFGNNWFSHILGAHTEELFDPETVWGKKNIAALRVLRKNDIHSLEFKGGITRYACLKCKKAVDRYSYANKHKGCIRDCNGFAQSILQKLGGEQQTPPSEVVNTVVAAGPAVSDTERLAYQKIIYEMAVEIRDIQEWRWYFDKLVEYPEVNDLFQSLVYENDDKYEPAEKLSDLAKKVDISWDTLQAAYRKRFNQ